MKLNHPINITIISGGQTGVDRAALDFALNHNISCGGWCPKGRKADDGVIPARYSLKEVGSVNYPVRTRQNIIQSDGTLIMYDNKFDPGTGLTLQLCKKLDKPIKVIRLRDDSSSVDLLRWINKNGIKILNIAGPRESSEPGIYKKTYSFLVKIFIRDND